jgi:hypothetical protein
MKPESRKARKLESWGKPGKSRSLGDPTPWVPSFPTSCARLSLQAFKLSGFQPFKLSGSPAFLDPDSRFEKLSVTVFDVTGTDNI